MAIPALKTDHCIVYCISCGRSTTTPTYIIEGLFGWLPYGRVTNKLHCKRGCGDRFGMVLPMDAPTPRLFAERYDVAWVERQQPMIRDRDLEAGCRDAIIELGDGGTFLKVHAKSEDPAIVWWGFNYLLKRFADRHGGPPHLIVARGAQWSRDSKRDFKVVAGKVVELGPEDPDPEEEGIG